MVTAAYAIARSRFRFGGSVMMPSLDINFFPAVAINAPLFVRFRRVGIIGTYRAPVVPGVVFALPLTVVVPHFATVYTVDYGAWAAAAVVVTVPLVVLVLVFRHRIVPGLISGAAKV